MLALYSLMLALKVVFKFNERDAKQLRYITRLAVAILLVTRSMALVKVGATPDDIPDWTRYGGLIFNLTTLLYGFAVCAIYVRQFGRLIITEPYRHVRLRWSSIAFAALCGCLYTLGRLYVTYAMFGTNGQSHPLDTPIRIFLIAAFCGLGVLFLMGPLFKYVTRLWMYLVAWRQLRAMNKLHQALDIRPIIENQSENCVGRWRELDARLC